MRIKALELKNFKRFTDLKIEAIPESSKLVLLIGANGSGKSSVFDAFNWLRDNYIGEYYNKRMDADILARISFDKSREITIEAKYQGQGGYVISRYGQEGDKKYPPGSAPIYDWTNRFFYGRSSVRIVPRIGNGGNIDVIKNDQDRPQTYIDADSRFNTDVYQYIQQVNNAIREPVFKGENADVRKIFLDFIEPFNTSLKNIFGDNEKTTIQIAEFKDAGPSQPPKLIFAKGDSKVNYDLLSHGEKQVVILLLNFVVRNAYHQDTIYYIDEMDCHLNTSLQKKLLQEIVTRWIPDNSQLWTATHALGFIDYAKESEQAVIIDLDLSDFDDEVTIVPSPKDNSDVYDIAVGKEFLPALFSDKRILFVENKDKDYYASIGLPQTVFVAENDKSGVYHKANVDGFGGVIDRDFLSDNDIVLIKAQFQRIRILNFYCIENYMYHPDNLEAFMLSRDVPFDKNQYIHDLVAGKNEVTGRVKLKISVTRPSYPFFKEPEFNNTERQNRFKPRPENLNQTEVIAAYLDSDDPNIFLKALSLKEYCTQLVQRQNIQKSDLVRTSWFKQQIETVVV